MSRELLQMAADTIEAMWDRHAGGKLNIDAASSSFMHRAQLTLAALRAALAAPVEPVYWQWRRKSTPWSTEYIFNSQAHATSPDSEVRALYTTPPAQPPIDGFGGNLDSAFDVPAVQPLTDEQIDALWRAPMSADWGHLEFARAIEAHHGIGGGNG